MIIHLTSLMDGVKKSPTAKSKIPSFKDAMAAFQQDDLKKSVRQCGETARIFKDQANMLSEDNRRSIVPVTNFWLGLYNSKDALRALQREGVINELAANRIKDVLDEIRKAIVNLDQGLTVINSGKYAQYLDEFCDKAASQMAWLSDFFNEVSTSITPSFIDHDEEQEQPVSDVVYAARG